MNRRVTVLISVLIVVALSWWIVRLRSRNAELTTRLSHLTAPNPPENPGAQLQLRRESQRLNRLRISLSEVTRGDTTGLDARLQRLHQDIAKLEAELASPLPDGRAFAAVNEEYRRQQLHAQGLRQAVVLSRRREVDERLADLGNQGAAERRNLEVERTEIEDELARIGGATRPNVANNELAQMQADRSEIERRVADLRADMMYWSEQKSGAGPAARQARAQALERAIQEQEVAIRRLSPRPGAPAAHGDD